jgi:hypothetical protein
MQKFLMGTAIGALLAFAFVRFNIEPPAVLKLPEKLRGNLVSTAVESELYDLTSDAATRVRALKVYFANRAQDAAKLDAASGHPFLSALHRERASREARQLENLWQAYEAVLSKAALRASLEKKYGVTETENLKRAMLFEAFNAKPFLKTWMRLHVDPATKDNLRDLLGNVAATPEVSFVPEE